MKKGMSALIVLAYITHIMFPDLRALQTEFPPKEFLKVPLNAMVYDAGTGTLDEKKLQDYLAQGVDINAPTEAGEIALKVAADLGHYAVVKLLLEHGARVNSRENNKQGMTPLIAAIFENHPDVVKLLLDRGADVNLADKTGRTPLMAAAFRGNIPVARELLARYADINATTQYGESAIMIGIEGIDDPAFTVFLLDNGANIDVKSNSMRTPLMTAAYYDRPQNVRLLLDRGVLINEQDNIGDSALLKAAYRGYPAIVRILLDKGADINIKTKNGITPLMAAIQQSKKAVVRMLLQENADTTIHNNVGTTAIDAAEKNPAMKEIFVRHELILAEARSILADIQQLIAGEEQSLVDLRETERLLNQFDQLAIKDPDMIARAQQLRGLVNERKGAALKNETVQALTAYQERPTKNTLKNVRKLASELEALGNQDYQETIQKVKQALQKTASGASQEPTAEEQKAQCDRKKAEAQKLIEAIQARLTDNDIVAAKKLLQEFAALQIADANLNQNYVSLVERWKQQQAIALQDQLSKALATYKQRPSVARLQEVSALIKDIEDLKLPALKEYIRSMHQQLRSSEKELETKSALPEVQRVSPPPTAEATQVFLIFDPYQALAAIPQTYQASIRGALEKLSQDFENSAAEKLASYEGLWRIRVGDYRIIYTLLPQQHAIGIVSIAPRASVYEDEALLHKRDADFIALNTYSTDELLHEAETLLKSNKVADAGRASELLEMYRSLRKDQQADVGDYLKSLLYSATARLKLQDFAQARELFTRLIPQAIEYHTIQQQARVGLAQVELQQGNRDAATTLLQEAVTAAKSNKERKELQERLDKLQRPSPTSDDTIRKLRQKFVQGQTLITIDPRQAEEKLEEFLKESSRYEELSAEQKEAVQLLNSLSEQKTYEMLYQAAIDEFEAGNYEDAVQHFNAYLKAAGSSITQARRKLIAEYIAESQLGQAIAKSTK